MKTKLYFAALALPLAFGACTNDDFETVSPNQGADGELVEVGPGFAISASKGGNDAATRGQWIKTESGLNYAWWPNYVYDEKDGKYEAVRDEIGLCWVGQSVGTNVYTNYRFQHAGWLNEDETTAEIDACEPYEIENGYELKGELSWDQDKYNLLKDENSLKSTALDLLKGKYDTESNQYLATVGGTSRNLNSAFFRTPSETLFKGDYIAYLPFTPEMTEAGAVLAHSPKEVTVAYDEVGNDANKSLKFSHLGSEMFMYAYAPGLVGGTQASNFSFKHLSGLIQIKARGDFSYWKGGANANGNSGVTSVTIVDSEGKFITEVGLDASKIVAEGDGASTGSALYVPGTAKYTNMLTANIDNTNSNIPQGNNEELSIVIPALPTKTGALKVIIYNHDLKLSAVYDKEAIEVVPGRPVTIDLGNIDIKQFTEKIATTEKALYQMTNSQNGTAVTGDEIELLGDIELGTFDKDGWTMGRNVTIKGGKIIVPKNYKWNIGSSVTIDSDLEIENGGCCDDNGLLMIGKNRASLKVALNGTIDNYGDIQFLVASTATTDKKNVTTITGKLNNHETLVKETGETNYANITISPLTQVDLKGATVVNNGNIEIKAVGNNSSAEDGQLELDKDASITNNHNFANAGNVNSRGGKLQNEAEGWIIDRVSAQWGETQPVNNGGQYVCEVNGQTRLHYALNIQELTTRVRFISLDAQPSHGTGGATYDGKTYTKAPFDLTGVKKPNIDFEIGKVVAESGEAIRFFTNDVEKKGEDVEIGDLIITSGSLDIMNFTKYDATTKKYVNATLKVKDIIVDGEKAYNSKLTNNLIEVSGNVEVKNMAKGQKVTFGGIAVTNGVYALSEMRIGGNFTVGSTDKTEKAAVEFNNNNRTDMKGNFSLYKNASCDIKVATSTTIDNWAAEVWASAIAVNEGTWANSTRVKVGSHPLFK
ncbi:MAG TPA: hypothetical protein H9824_00155 [Candidatus Bacteroides pullicola]|uniref:Fimbrillin family protein n=1 Tax=Candidatus Bacteroides pullicola TaxID=2838475 RepID=A0A9D1ZGI0_9BACE|nr:hypothetical protein [Candidatus Bacteroides pullicola]